MNRDKASKFSKSMFYQELPPEVAETLPEASSTNQFLTSILPISESVGALAKLNRTNVGIESHRDKPKKAKPRQKKFGLSLRERRAVGLYRHPKFSISYNEAIPMLRLWEDYMYQFLKLDRLQNKEWFNPKSGHLWENMSVTLMKADYHGALLKVASSKCQSLVGLQGIVIFDTKFTFTIVGKDNMNRILPKQSCIFEVYLKNIKFKIFGKYFCIRSGERSSKKTKLSLIPLL